MNHYVSTVNTSKEEAATMNHYVSTVNTRKEEANYESIRFNCKY